MNGGFGGQIRSIVILPLYPQKIENSHTCVNSPCTEGKCCRERYKQSADAVANAIQVLQDYYAQGAFAQVSDSHWHCWETPGTPADRRLRNTASEWACQGKYFRAELWTTDHWIFSTEKTFFIEEVL